MAVPTAKATAPSGLMRAAKATTVPAAATVLAATVPVLAGITVVRAFRRRFRHHKRIARWTLPIWLYVSVTGVVVYWMLYQVRW